MSLSKAKKRGAPNGNQNAAKGESERLPWRLPVEWGIREAIEKAAKAKKLKPAEVLKAHFGVQNRPASGDGEQMTMNTPPTNFEPLPARAGSLTVDQMADALGLYACDFWAKHPRDCDVCSDAKEGEMIWVMMAGAYPGSTQEAEYYACSECVAVKHAAAFSSENTDSTT